MASGQSNSPLPASFPELLAGHFHYAIVRYLALIEANWK